MMKKYLASLLLGVCFTASHSQVLFTEDFNSYPVGNFGTDFTGTIPNQGGWYTGKINFDRKYYRTDLGFDL